jgi:thiol-disulfide isomerase/thioredoxin
MKEYFTTLFILLFSGLLVGSKPDSACNPFSVTLHSLQGKAQKTILNNEEQGAVFVFLLPDCPACQNYSTTLNNLAKKFPKIRFTGLFPGGFYTDTELKSFISEYRISFPVFLDKKKDMVRCLRARIVPEVFLISKENKIIYSGRIDDWMYALGKKKQHPSSHDLQKAIEQFLSHQPVSVSRTKAVGCYIE